MPHGIFPPGLAKMHVERAGKPYTPSSGTEGSIFIESWCGECQRDRAMREGIDFLDIRDPETESCQILNASFRGEATQWQYDQNGQPCCTAFVSNDEPVHAPRCEHTTDMFGE